MKNTSYSCDICGSTKSERDIWVMAFVTRAKQTIFKKWNPKSRSKKIKHLCGPDCEVKFLLGQTTMLRAPVTPRGQNIELIRHVGPAPYVSTKISVDEIEKVVA